MRRFGIVYIKEGVIWVSFRGEGQFFPQAWKLLAFTNFVGLRDSLCIVSTTEFKGRIEASEALIYCTDFEALAEKIWTIIQPLLSSPDLKFNSDIRHCRYAVIGSWKVHVHCPDGDFHPSSK